MPDQVSGFGFLRACPFLLFGYLSFWPYVFFADLSRMRSRFSPCTPLEYIKELPAHAPYFHWKTGFAHHINSVPLSPLPSGTFVCWLASGVAIRRQQNLKS
jgi:hypothetical protein